MHFPGKPAGSKYSSSPNRLPVLFIVFYKGYNGITPQYHKFHIFKPLQLRICLEKVHQGRAVKRIREILQVKQETLASELGISQQSVSLLETKETIAPETLEKIAEVLKVPMDAIKNFNEEAAINNIACNFNDNSSVNYKPVFNSMEKMVGIY
ncbi:helix-turn-helix domain-containing protein [Niastella koreensis]|uniref:helix-turn-helix domain-containing protein n=1 Tax=Niastella koreensis TaxID=354356 RepID=UPI001F61CB39|nr:helix-turn-helix transcriptional regulator [Niastella koreensis]